MATTAQPGLLAKKPTSQLLEAAEGTQLRRAVGALDLTAFGIGAIIGTGIFGIYGYRHSRLRRGEAPAETS